MKPRDRKKKRGHKPDGRSGEQWMPISYAMAKSIAWRSLSGNAIKLWVEIRRRFTGGNNGEIRLGLDEAGKILFMGKSSVCRARKELIDKGFIVIAQQGVWEGRSATLYAVTDKRFDGPVPTNNWKDWRPMDGLTGRRKNQNCRPYSDPKGPDIGTYSDPSSSERSDLVPIQPDSEPDIGTYSARLYNHPMHGADGEPQITRLSKQQAQQAAPRTQSVKK